jgi:hypothetical protein
MLEGYKSAAVVTAKKPNPLRLDLISPTVVWFYEKVPKKRNY